MIVHFVKDEKIIDQVIENFLKISTEHVFLVFTGCQKEDFKYLKFRSTATIQFFNIDVDDINIVLKQNRAKAIVLHSLDYLFAKAIEQIDFDIKIAWIVWGFEIYLHPKFRSNLYGKRTLQFLRKKRPKVFVLWYLKTFWFLRYITNNLLGITNSYLDLQEKALGKIDVFGTYIYEDYILFKRLFPKFNVVYQDVAFCTIHQYVGGNGELKVHKDARNILVGNSNSLESNYLDVIDVLSSVENIGTAYFVLSYGNDSKHKNAVIKRGSQRLKERFYPLMDFMKLPDYIKILQSCSVGVFLHYRQQAMGNIIAMLYMGARVYLSVRNPSLFFFMRNGISIFSLENDFGKYRCSPLEESKQRRNRQRLIQLFREEKVLGDLKVLVDSLLG